MHQVDDAPMETLHIYFEREQPPRPSLLPMFLSVCALFTLVAVSVFSPPQQPVMRAVIRVPAVLLPPRTFTAQTPVIPTGVHTYPAATAHGTLTITNGSVISQTLPAGLFFISTSGLSVITDTAVFVPTATAWPMFPPMRSSVGKLATFRHLPLILSKVPASISATWRRSRAAAMPTRSSL